MLIVRCDLGERLHLHFNVRAHTHTHIDEPRQPSAPGENKTHSVQRNFFGRQSIARAQQINTLNAKLRHYLRAFHSAGAPAKDACTTAPISKRDLSGFEHNSHTLARYFADRLTAGWLAGWLILWVGRMSDRSIDHRRRRRRRGRALRPSARERAHIICAPFTIA